VSNAAYAALPIGGRSAFFRVNLLAGQAEPVGFFSSRNQVVDIAIPLNQRWGPRRPTAKGGAGQVDGPAPPLTPS
jgi:hypothetical protein